MAMDWERTPDMDRQIEGLVDLLAAAKRHVDHSACSVGNRKAVALAKEIEAALAWFRPALPEAGLSGSGGMCVVEKENRMQEGNVPDQSRAFKQLPIGAEFEDLFDAGDFWFKVNERQAMIVARQAVGSARPKEGHVQDVGLDWRVRPLDRGNEAEGQAAPVKARPKL